MTIVQSIKWFKTTFIQELTNAVQNTPFSVDQLCAIAYQETGYIWSVLVDKKLPIVDVLTLCVGDTIDARIVNGRNVGRSAFPKTKSELLAWKDGQQMFDIARKCLVDMAKHVNGYGSAVKNANKFSHGFGIFQYDIQFFKTNPSYFLNQEWANMDNCLKQVIRELRAAQTRQGWTSKDTLTDYERIHICIAYNRGRSVLTAGLKQGHKSDDGRYYGENINEYLTLAKSIIIGEPVVEKGVVYAVDVASKLMLRKSPNKESDIIARLPAGHQVMLVSGKTGDSWLEVKTTLSGAEFIGFAFAEFLKKVPKVKELPVEIPSIKVTSDPFPPAVYCPRKAGTVTVRKELAGARSLNEPKQPTRSAADAAGRVLELHAIIKWLAVDNSQHLRYQPTSTATFCNIYAHDYCHLAGVYFPRVWWSGPALMTMAKGGKVEPLIGDTIDEQRANDVFRWLVNFGLAHGWQRVSDLTTLQEHANTGGVALIIARRKEEGRSGHVTIVAPETDAQKAKRDAQGLVTVPLQSQAGSVNFSYGRGTQDWWLHERFADSAFWIHA